MSNRPLYLKQLQLGPMQNFIYLLGDPTTKEAAVIDPGWEVPEILRAAERDGYRITKALVTHSHFDHVMGLKDLLSRLDIPVYIHKTEAGLLDVSPSSVKPLESGATVEVGTIPVNIIHTPGHSPGSQCFLVDDQLLSGDTLFIRACGRCDLPGGDPTALFESLSKKLKALHDHTILYPGHHYANVPTSTMGDEKRGNPFLQPRTLQEFLGLLGLG